MVTVTAYGPQFCLDQRAHSFAYRATAIEEVMAPKRKLTPACSLEEQASKMQRRILELRNKAMRSKMSMLFRSKPELMRTCADHLVDIQAVDGSFFVGGVLAEGDGDDDGDESTDQKAVKTLNRNFTKIASIPMSHLQDWLSELEDKALSKHQLKLVIRRGSYKESHERLAEIWECVTGIAPNVLLFGGKSGEEGAAERFMQEIVIQNKAGLRIGRELNMPPDWDSGDGWWAVFMDGDAIKLRNTRRRNIVVQVPDDLVQDCRDINDLKITLNFSEARATICGRTALLARTCAEISKDYDTHSRRGASAFGSVSLTAARSSRSEAKLALEYGTPAIEDDKPSGSTPKSPTEEPIADAPAMTTMSYTKADMNTFFDTKPKEPKQRSTPKAAAAVPNSRGRGPSKKGRPCVDETCFQPPIPNA